MLGLDLMGADDAAAAQAAALSMGPPAPAAGAPYRWDLKAPSEDVAGKRRRNIMIGAGAAAVLVGGALFIFGRK